jgi:S1-C subfamily serine protease
VLFGITLAAANNDPEAGVLVAAVTKGSSADEGGVKARDRILTWNDQELEDARAWRQLLARHSPGDEVKFEVRRGSEVLLLKTVLRAPGR